MPDRKVILDVETTGLSPEDGHRIVEIAAVEFIGRSATNSKIHFYVNPERPVADAAFRVHGLSNSFLADKPKFRDVAVAVADFIGDSTIVAHNAMFDARFLNRELNRCGMALYPKSRFIDTLKVAREKFPSSRCNLDALAKRAGIKEKRGFHGALKDCLILGEVYTFLLSGKQPDFLDMLEISASQGKEEADNVVYPATKLIVLSHGDALAHHEFCQKNNLKGWKYE